jgi:hypothetical protein
MPKKTETRPTTAHIAPFGLRMQPDLREKLEAAATKSGRSLNAEIVERLEASFFDVNQEAQRRLDLAYADLGATAPLAILGMVVEGKLAKDNPIVKLILERVQENFFTQFRAIDAAKSEAGSEPDPQS